MNRQNSHHSPGTNEIADSPIRNVEIVLNDNVQNISSEINNSRSTNESEAPFHHWINGEPIYLERTPVEDEKFDAAEKKEKTEQKMT